MKIKFMKSNAYHKYKIIICHSLKSFLVEIFDIIADKVRKVKFISWGYVLPPICEDLNEEDH